MSSIHSFSLSLYLVLLVFAWLISAITSSADSLLTSYGMLSSCLLSSCSLAVESSWQHQYSPLMCAWPTHTISKTKLTLIHWHSNNPRFNKFSQHACSQHRAQLQCSQHSTTPRFWTNSVHCTTSSLVQCQTLSSPQLWQASRTSSSTTVWTQTP